MGFGLNNALDGLRDLFNQAEQLGSPIILDVDNDGVETISVKSGAYFDHAGDGFAEQTGWTSSDDGLLVRDVNGDGIINDGKELFGNETLLNNGQKADNGFQALAEMDINSDGKVDGNDAAFNQLKIWQDADGDGLSLPDELHTLEELGIQSISTQSDVSNTIDPEGNTQTRIGSFVKTDNTTGQIADYNFQRDMVYTIAEKCLEVPTS